MFITFITTISILFLFFSAVVFSLFLDSKEFWWKLYYILMCWISLFGITYFYSQILLETFDSYLWKYIFIKNFQDVLTIRLDISFFLANIGGFLLIIFYAYLIIKDYKYQHELFWLKIIIFSIIFLILFAFCVIRYDIFLSTWELLSQDEVIENVDVQVDYLSFFHEFADDYLDFLKYLFCFYFLMFGIYFSNKIKSSIIYLRLVMYIFFVLFLIYYFGWLLLTDFIILFFIGFLFIESYIYFYLVIKSLFKIKIKTMTKLLPLRKNTF